MVEFDQMTSKSDKVSTIVIKNFTSAFADLAKPFRKKELENSQITDVVRSIPR